jgi:hypothetical protein
MAATPLGVTNMRMMLMERDAADTPCPSRSLYGPEYDIILSDFKILILKFLKFSIKLLCSNLTP